MTPARRRIPVHHGQPGVHMRTSGSARAFLAQEFGGDRVRRGRGRRALGVRDVRVPDIRVPGRPGVGGEDLLPETFLQVGELAGVGEDALVGEGGEQAPTVGYTYRAVQGDGLPDSI